MLRINTGTIVRLNSFIIVSCNDCEFELCMLVFTVQNPKMNVLNLEECELLTDSKYRAYVSQVERALKAFEYTSEWADLISSLGKLNKVHDFFYSNAFVSNKCWFYVIGDSVPGVRI